MGSLVVYWPVATKDARSLVNDGKRRVAALPMYLELDNL